MRAVRIHPPDPGCGKRMTLTAYPIVHIGLPVDGEVSSIHSRGNVVIVVDDI